MTTPNDRADLVDFAVERNRRGERALRQFLLSHGFLRAEQLTGDEAAERDAIMAAVRRAYAAGYARVVAESPT